MEQAHGFTGRTTHKSEERRALRLAIRDVAFLYFLCSNLNWRLSDHKRANWLYVALVATSLRSEIMEHDDPATAHLGRWWFEARAALHAAYVQQGVVASIADRYFAGISPLFPDIADDVAFLVTNTEQVVGLFNDVFAAGEPSRKRRGQPAAPAAPESLAPLAFIPERQAAMPAIEAEVALVVDLAKAEALELIGEREAGFPLVARHVWPSGA
jgi:hypothetical protein